MKILYHHRTKAADGQYVHIAELTAALAALGHELIMVGPGEAGPRRMDAGTGGSASLRARLPGWLYELLEFGYAGIAFWRLWRACRRHRPDAVYERYNLFCPAGVWLKRLTGLPLAMEINAPLRDERSIHGGLRLKRLARWTEEYAWRGADVCLPVTDVLAAHVAAAGVPPVRIHTVPNGVSDAFAGGLADGGEVRARFGLTGKLVLGFTGFVRPWHGLDRAIRLLADGRMPPNAHLLVVGDGPALPDLRSLAASLGVGEKVTFAGVAQREEMPSFVAAFDIALQPHAVTYASPLKLFEYMALGRAVVAPTQANIEEVLTHGRDALLFDPGDADSFAASIARLANDAALRRRLGDAARKTLLSRNLTWRHNAERVSALLAAAMARHGAGFRAPPEPGPTQAGGAIPARE